MGINSPRLTGPTLKIISALMDANVGGASGADLTKSTGVASGTLYPILFRLEKAGWFESEWEKGDPSKLGRPRKRLYRITPLGARNAKAAWEQLLPAGGRLVWNH